MRECLRKMRSKQSSQALYGYVQGYRFPQRRVNLRQSLLVCLSLNIIPCVLVLLKFGDDLFEQSAIKQD